MVHDSVHEFPLSDQPPAFFFLGSGSGVRGAKEFNCPLDILHGATKSRRNVIRVEFDGLSDAVGVRNAVTPNGMDCETSPTHGAAIGGREKLTEHDDPSMWQTGRAPMTWFPA